MRSLSAPRSSGERAFAYRGLAQLRRQVLPSVVALFLLVDIVAPFVLLEVAPMFTWAWTIVVVLGSIAGGGSLLAVELAHYHLRLAPVRPLRALVWLAAVPAIHRVASMELAWFPVQFAPGVSTGEWLTGVVLIPCVVALVEATGGLAVSSSRHVPTRAAFRTLLALAALVGITALLGAATTLGLPTLLATPLVAAAMLASTHLCFQRTARRIWTKEANP